MVETPTLVGKEGKLTMAPDSTMYVHVPMGRFNFEDQENTWDHVAEMCEHNGQRGERRACQLPGRQRR